ncbi:hypothetical protein JCM19992_26980 [Thermostilla marina]
MIVAQLELSPDALQWVYLVLVWIGFGAVVGLLAKTILPGREPRGPFGVLVVGILGTMVGPLVLTSALPLENFNPISPLGFLVSMGAAIVLLIGYRFLLLVAADFFFVRGIDEETDDDEYEYADEEYEYVYR